MPDLYFPASSLINASKTIIWHKNVTLSRGMIPFVVVIGRRCIAPFRERPFFTGIWDGKSSFWLSGKYDLTWKQAVSSAMYRSAIPVFSFSDEPDFEFEEAEDFLILPSEPEEVYTQRKELTTIKNACSLCGKKGHNKRTCSLAKQKVKKKQEAAPKKVQKSKNL